MQFSSLSCFFSQGPYKAGLGKASESPGLDGGPPDRTDPQHKILHWGRFGGFWFGWPCKESPSRCSQVLLSLRSLCVSNVFCCILLTRTPLASRYHVRAPVLSAYPMLYASRASGFMFAHVDLEAPFRNADVKLTDGGRQVA